MKKFLLVVNLLIFIVGCSSKKEKILPQKRNLTESVYTSVVVQPDSLYKVFAAVSGILDANLIEEGDTIVKNQALFQIINSTPKLNTQNALLTLQLAKENYYGNAAILKGIKDEINAAGLNYKNDSINFFRQQNLWQQKIGSKVEFDSKKLKYELSLNSLHLLKSKYARTKSELETTIKQAENNYKTSLIGTKDFTVKSKIKGKIYAMYKEPGEVISTIEPLAVIGSTSNFIIEMLVDEVDIVKITPNQDVLITLDAYNGKLFNGKVSKISPKKDERNQTFTVEAVFTLAPKKLYAGLSGEANIIIATKNNALTIPKEYLINTNKVKTENGIVEITIGLQNLEFVEVLSGILENTYIYKP